MSELQTLRTVQVYDGVTSENVAIQTAFDKWTDIAPLITEAFGRDIDLSKREAVLKSTKGILKFPDALVPPGDQIIFLVQAKMKSGVEKAVKAFSDMSYNELRRAYKAVREADETLPSLGGNPESSTLIKALEGATGIKNIKTTTKVGKVKKEEIVKLVKTLAKDTEPNLAERVLSLEQTLGKTIDGLGTLFDSLRGKSTYKPVQVIESSFSEQKLIAKDPIAPELPQEKKLLTKSELAAEFSKIKM